MSAFGVASTIFEFLGDSARTSLKLPHMTTGQRRSVKKLVQQHPELRCESYGFGEERQLYLFKAGAAEATQLESDHSSLTLASLAKMSTQKPRSASPDCSTTASSEASNESSPLIVTPAMQEVVQVRNTFIHCENTPIDERVVQSMPRNMFRQSILAECSQRVVAHDTLEPASEAERHPMDCPFEAEARAGQRMLLRPGTLVVVEGLVKLPAFNGQSAVVQGWDEATDRYNILIVCASAPGGCQQAKIKEENLRTVL